jgi:hypothetical protein
MLRLLILIKPECQAYEFGASIETEAYEGNCSPD